MRNFIVVGLVACASNGEPALTEILGTPSDQRETRDIRLDARAISFEGSTSISVAFIDRLAEEPLRLVGGDAVSVQVNATSYPLTEELFHSSTYIVEPRYVVTVPIADPGNIVVDFRRADGSVARSTIVVPESYELTSEVPRNIRIGDLMSIMISPGRGEMTGFVNWACDASARDLTDTRRPIRNTSEGSTVELYVSEELNDPEPTSHDCDAWFALLLSAEGQSDPALAVSKKPLGLQARRLDDIHLWPRH